MTPVLQWALPLALIMLALAMGCCLVRLLKGPSAQDRVVAADGMAMNGKVLTPVLGQAYRLSPIHLRHLRRRARG